MIELAETVEKIGKVADFQNLTPKNIKTMSNAIKVVNEFNDKIQHYGKHIFESLHLDTIEGWMVRLSDKDIPKFFKEVESYDLGTRYIFCYKTKSFYRFKWSDGWTSGARGNFRLEYKLDESTLEVTQHWETQAARFDHEPWVKRERTFIINYVTGEILDVYGDDINKVSKNW
jgi:hypothetical protein